MNEMRLYGSVKMSHYRRTASEERILAEHWTIDGPAILRRIDGAIVADHSQRGHWGGCDLVETLRPAVPVAVKRGKRT